MVLYLAWLVLLAHAAARTHDPFGRLIAAGVLIVVGVQALLNMCISLRLAPITGLPLPLVSYGGSSLVTTFAALGLVASVRMHDSRRAVREPAGG